MRLGRKIYNEDGMVLLAENCELTDGIIRRLRNYGFDFIYVNDPLTDDVTIPDLIEDETALRALSEIRSNFSKLTEPAISSQVYPFLGKTFLSVIENIMDDINSREDVMIMLMNINSIDHYLYRHSLNVCIYTLLLGQFHGYSKEELSLLGLGALLHDIGKTKLPLEILNKPGRLNDVEYEIIKQHTEFGFDMLRQEPEIHEISAHCAYQHHERLDGTGYPRGLVGDEIHEFARWIAITDAYDAMTTHRSYRAAMLPHQALEVLYTGSGHWYEKSKLELFRNKVAIYPPGMSVKLSTGEQGVVAKIHGHIPQRPVIRILTDPAGVKLRVPYDLDLSVNHSVVVTEVEGGSLNSKAQMDSAG